MRAFCLDADDFSAQAFRSCRFRRYRRQGRETGRSGIIRPGKIERRAGLRIDADGRHERVALIVIQRVDQCIEAARLDRASNFQLLANGAREIDVEAGERSVRQREMERRIIVLGQEPQAAQAAQIGLGGAMMRVPKARHEDAAGRRSGVLEPRRAGRARTSAAKLAFGCIMTNTKRKFPRAVKPPRDQMLYVAFAPIGW